MLAFVLKQGYDVYNLSYSPITGGDGNIEFLLHLRWEGSRSQAEGTNYLEKTERQIVNEAHSILKEKKQTEKQE